MNNFLILTLEVSIAIVFIALVLWIVLRRSHAVRNLNLQDETFSAEEFEWNAKKTAGQHIITTAKLTSSWPLDRLNENYRFILGVYKDLNENIKKNHKVPAVSEWLLDNFYIIEEQVKGLRRDLNKRSYSRLPVLKSGPLKGYTRIFAIVMELVVNTNGNVNDKKLQDYLKAYQTHSVLLEREIWAIPVVLRLALVESIRSICEKIKATQTQWRKADEIFEDWLANEEQDPKRILKLFRESLHKMDDISPTFIDHLVYHLKSSGRSYAEILFLMEENLIRFGLTTEQMSQKEHARMSVNTVAMGNCISSLRFFSSYDWSETFEAASSVEQILKMDPDGTYEKMDLATRNHYRSTVEEIALRYGVSETYIAKLVVDFATKAYDAAEDKQIDDTKIQRTWHVGHYLIGKGSKALEDSQKKPNKVLPEAQKLVSKYPSQIYLGSITLIILLFIVLAIQYSFMMDASSSWLMVLLVGFCLIIPASEIGVNAVNWIVCKALKPFIFSRLELADGIPEKLSTIVAVPTLLPDPRRVEELLSNLEGHYLSNREENLYFALVGAFGDADEEFLPGDAEVVEAAMQGIKRLNKKYASVGKDKFFFFHRKRVFNEKNNKWFGWERKRGALIEFNELVLGDNDTTFSYQSCENPPFSHVKYIITLDSDTILPMGMARKMVGTMAHPLNRPIIDKERGIITDGYGLMQPRIDVTLESANKSFFSRVFAGQEGIDPYTNAISDVYQDLFKEGIFTGKGIYDLLIFKTVLHTAIPDDKILSHDLLEGSFLRTGLVTDLKLIDSYPSKYNAFAARLHRWVRGDWQLLPFLFKKYFEKNSERVTNPLSFLSKWKIFDNLRRSLLAPSLIIMLALSFSIFPGSVYFWLAIFLLAQTFPLLVALVSYVFSVRIGSPTTKRYMPTMLGLKSALLQGLLMLSFLPYQASLMVNAISVTLARVLVTKKNLLEWVTSADVEKSQPNSLQSYLKQMSASLIIAPVFLILAIIFKPSAIILGLILLVLWLSAPFIAYGISKDIKEQELQLPKRDIHELGKLARKTWRYFEEFSDSKSHYLVPDNYQADPLRGLAYRTSPTNIGLGLLAILAARDFGYIGTSEMIEQIEKTISSMEKLDKWNGHLFNWYDTRTAKPLQPTYVSTVDSGNLLGYLITLSQGLKDYLAKPLVDNRFSYGIRDTLQCAGVDGVIAWNKLITIHRLPFTENVDLTAWNQALNEIIDEDEVKKIKRQNWQDKVEHMLTSFKKEMLEMMPVIAHLASMPESFNNGELPAEINDKIQKLTAVLVKNNQLQHIPKVYQAALELVVSIIADVESVENGELLAEKAWLMELEQTLNIAIARVTGFIQKYQALLARIEALTEEMQFAPLYNKKKQLFSIGFNPEENKLTNSYYDLLASEARQTSYICIARGEIPAEHWSKMGRVLTVVDLYKGLISWTGTMFEYLMPLLIMKSYKNTMLDETYAFVLKSQKKFGKQRNMPWGISESGFNSLDKNHDYQYKAFGVPWLGLKRGLIDDAVVAPYATLLALQVDPVAAIKNIKYLQKEGMDGAYGLYEAADYTPERLPFESKRAIVKSFMAHHQGMSLLALVNTLHKNVMQSRFHADPAMHAARFLLQEKVPADTLYTKDNKEKIIPFKEVLSTDVSSLRIFKEPDKILPKAHILSNGNYSVMVTDRGTGYSKNKILALTRWREDSTLDAYGMFFYLRNLETDYIWSATYSPLNVLPEKYQVVFTNDKATFKRRDGQLETKTEVIVASGDNVEIRRITVKNTGEQICTIELTSYFEVVMAPQDADLAHPAFSNLFVDTSYQVDRRCLIGKRRPRTETEKNAWVANAILPEGAYLGEIEFETDRMQLLGRGNNVKQPLAMEPGRNLTNTIGAVLDPVMSLRVRMQIEPGKIARVSFITAIDESKDSLLKVVDKYLLYGAVKEAFLLAKARSRVEQDYLNLHTTELELYQELLSDIFFISPIRKRNQEMILQNTKGQSELWRYGISGDLPVVVLCLNKTSQMKLLYEVLKAHDYWRLMDVKADLVIISEEENSYTLPLYTLISDIVLAGQKQEVLERPGGIFIIKKHKIPTEDIQLLFAVARIILSGTDGSMQEQLQKRYSQVPTAKKQFTKKVTHYEAPATKERRLENFNGLGGFSPAGDEYVISLTGKQTTPLPWLNVIANPHFGFMVSEAGSGYTWYKNSRENKLTPWSNDQVSDPASEVIYLTDGDTGELWTTTALPIRETEPYNIRHGFGYSVFEHTSHGIKQRMTQHVPVEDTVKLSILNLKNLSDVERHLTLTYYIRPVLGVTDQVTAMHIKTSQDKAGTLLLENPYNEEFAGSICFIDASVKERTVTSDRKEFFGTGDLSSPDSLFYAKLSGEIGTGYDPCGALQVKITLKQNENKELVFLLGMAPEMKEVQSLVQKYRSVKNAKDSLLQVKNFWKTKLANVQVETPTKGLNLMLNGWLQYQTVSCRLWARTGFYQCGGAFGFRDQLQDSLAIAPFWPEATRAQILLHASRQFIEGDVQHWWHEPSGKGTRTKSSDDRLWLPYVTAEYIRITGDSEILEEEVHFLEDKPLQEYEDERYGIPTVSAVKSSLYEHCARAIEVSLQFGAHGLPLMGAGDWNDGMNTVGNKGKGESVWLGWFLATVLEMFVPISSLRGELAKADKYQEQRSSLVAALEQNAWDGNWYRRAYYDNGRPMGTAANMECRIDSIAQSWSVISGAGDPNRVREAMMSLEAHLVNWEDGLIKLLTPPFNKSEQEPGYIKGYIPGVRENGGQYTHAAAWAIIAFAKLGDGDKAWELFELINPINHTASHRDYSRYKTEPYVMAADVYSAAPHAGRGGWTWYTGAAGWMYRAGIEYILGLQKNGEMMIIDPCIPAKWPEYSLSYTYLSTKYQIKVQNPEMISKGVKRLALDGMVSASNHFKLIDDGKDHLVEVTMGI